MTLLFYERKMGRSLRFRLGVRLCRIMIALGCCSTCGAGIWKAIVVSLVHGSWFESGSVDLKTGDISCKREKNTGRKMPQFQ